jgi:predicted lipoprotein
MFVASVWVHVVVQYLHGSAVQWAEQEAPRQAHR